MLHKRLHRPLTAIAKAANPKSRFYLAGGEDKSTKEVAETVKELTPEAQIAIKPPTSVAAMWPQSYNNTKFGKDFD